MSAAPTTEEILDCLEEAVAEELERKRRLGHPAVMWKDGRVQWLMPNGEYVTEEPEEFRKSKPLSLAS